MNLQVRSFENGAHKVAYGRLIDSSVHAIFTGIYFKRAEELASPVAGTSSSHTRLPSRLLRLTVC
jgi:hypothetical protein